MRSRVAIAMVIGGGALAYFGIKELLVGAGSSGEPVPVSLADLEKGSPLPNNHIRLGKHVRLFEDCIYEYERPKHETGDPSPQTKVNHVYYPVLSESHPFVPGLRTLVSRYGGMEKVPESEQIPIGHFAVLVKTKSFRTVGALPGQYRESDELHGLVINRIEGLKAKEKELLSEGFPQMDFSKILILEEDRRPSSPAKYLGMTGGGAVLVLLGAGMVVAPWLRARREAAGTTASLYGRQGPPNLPPPS